MNFIVLFEDKSGVFGEWYQENEVWKFKRKYENLDLDEGNMMYALKELKKYKKTMNR